MDVSEAVQAGYNGLGVSVIQGHPVDGNGLLEVDAPPGLLKVTKDMRLYEKCKSWLTNSVVKAATPNTVCHIPEVGYMATSGPFAVFLLF